MYFRNVLRALLFVLASALVFSAPASAQPAPAPTTQVHVAKLPPIAKPAAAAFDAEKATDAYLATVKGKARAQSDAYFEGGYVLQVVDVIYALVVAGILLWLHLSSW